MWCYKPCQKRSVTQPRYLRRAQAAGLVVAALVVLGLATPQALAGLVAPLCFSSGGFDTYSVAMADLNGDGIPDLVVPNNYSNNVSVFLGNGDGTFQPAVNYDAGTGAIFVAIADLNHDGIPDLAVADLGGTSGGNPGTVSILLGKGDGTFGAAQSFAAGLTPRTVVVGDFNGDGVPDLAVAAEGTASTGYPDGAISVLLGNGDGTFGAAASYPAPVRPAFVVTADFNGDGHLDLAVANYAIPGTVSVLLGKGDGTFAAAVQYSTGSLAYGLAVGDLNGDGKPDLAVANAGENYVSVLLGNGDGTFQAAVNYTVGGVAPMGGSGTGVSAVTLADVNGDGHLDLVAIFLPVGVSGGGFSLEATGSGTLAVLLGKGDGTFQAPQTYECGGDISVAVADFNRDGIPDVAVVDRISSTVNVLLGTGGGAVKTTPSYAAEGVPQAAAVSDLNGDGHLDVVTANLGTNTVSVLLGNGDGTFQAEVGYGTGQAPVAIAIGDFNGDGKPDLVTVDQGSDSVGILLGNGDGTLQGVTEYPASANPSSSDALIAVAVGDFNGDGHLDLAVTNGPIGTINVLLGNGDGTFQTPQAFDAGGAGPNFLAVGDFNGDGKLDLAVALLGTSSAGTSVGILLGNGDGTFQAATTYTAGTNPYWVAVADFNGDGHPDLAVANLGDQTVIGPGSVSILLGKGDGTFQPALNYTTQSAAVWVSVSDFNGDGHPDLALVLDGSSAVYLGNGDGTFNVPQITYLGGAAPLSGAVGDFNGDGKPDVAVVNTVSGDVSIQINDSKWGN